MYEQSGRVIHTHNGKDFSTVFGEQYQFRSQWPSALHEGLHRTVDCDITKTWTHHNLIPDDQVDDFIFCCQRTIGWDIASVLSAGIFQVSDSLHRMGTLNVKYEVFTPRRICAGTAEAETASTFLFQSSRKSWIATV